MTKLIARLIPELLQSTKAIFFYQTLPRFKEWFSVVLYTVLIFVFPEVKQTAIDHKAWLKRFISNFQNCQDREVVWESELFLQISGSMYTHIDIYMIYL